MQRTGLFFLSSGMILAAPPDLIKAQIKAIMGQTSPAKPKPNRSKMFDPLFGMLPYFQDGLGCGLDLTMLLTARSEIVITASLL